ncbi:MAG: hypothetical protein KKD56_06390 [Acidobacteria bacterium]|nr:hypothetical protein [Acidobacteriota bacterium]MCG2815520.1 hypothetical protein [Candidatus Aminicenantes bacterium]MBU1475125.1 hypothetical protein [Acidobacteriota bacterium]MBU2438689.1 hypothetical protein [Acidobacteriota bacterium]MBU4204094.1 hypothetical protein [Acidobacteriota bacterium]
MTNKRLTINLATQPRQNRRLLYLVAGLMTVIFCAAIGQSIFLLTTYGRKNIEASSTLAELDSRLRQVEEENRKTAESIQAAEETNRKKIDRLNGVILHKGFSWTAFLAELESLLPDSCYIVSLAPVPRSSREVDVGLQVAAPSLNELLLFIRRLTERNFRPSVRGETKAENGYLLAGVTFVYQGTL